MSEQETSVAAETTNEADANGGDNGQAAPAAPQAEPSANPQGAKNLLTGAKAEAGGEAKEGQQPNETKTEGGEKKSEESQKKEEPEGAPEQYEDFSAPEGLSYDEQFIGTFKDAAKEVNLSQKQAQHLLDKCAPVLAQRQIEQIEAVSKQWEERTKTDKEIGGENWTRASSDIARVRDKFGINADGKMDPDIQEFMQTPIGNHPGLLKLLARVGRAFGEADFPRGAPAPKQISPDDVYR